MAEKLSPTTCRCGRIKKADDGLCIRCREKIEILRVEYAPTNVKQSELTIGDCLNAVLHRSIGEIS